MEPGLCPNAGMGKFYAEKRQLNAIADRLLDGQRALGLKPSEIADMSGIKRNTYSQWVNAKGRPQLDEAMKLCEAFGYTLDWIYFGDPQGLPYALAKALGLPAAAPPEPRSEARKRA